MKELLKKKCKKVLLKNALLEEHDVFIFDLIKIILLRNTIITL